MKVDIKSFMKQAKFHADILLRGIGRTLYGAFIFGLIGIAVYGFTLIQGESGYAAVFDFVASCSLLILSLCNIYLLGGKRKGGKK